MDKQDKIYVAGHKGLVGSALLRALSKGGYKNIVVATKQELDLRETAAVKRFFDREQPEYVFLSAAKVGGIQANRTHPVEFLLDNLMIQNNVIQQSYKAKVKKLAFLGTSCVYPRECPQPMKEEYLMTGPLEPTNEGYALAKIAGMKLTQYYHQQYGFPCINPLPCNIYGPNDCFDLENSHVLSALVKRFVDAIREGKKEIRLWGSGVARREFMHVDDLAMAVIFLMLNWDSAAAINVGYGKDISIKELAEIVAHKAGFKGEIHWDSSMPDGMLKKCLDVSKMTELGFTPSIKLEDGIKEMIAEYNKL